MLLNPLSTKECFVDNDHDSDVNFYHDVSMLDTQYFVSDKFKTTFKDFSKNSFSVFHLNIRSINKISKLLLNFTRNWTTYLVLYAFLKHGQVSKT